MSGFREYKGTDYIQTTAPISKGSSGGGLFDAQGRLVGITTMYLKDGQALNFAVPAELIASVPMRDQGMTRVAVDGAAAAADAAQVSADEAAAAADAAADAAAAEEYERPRDRWWTFYEDGQREIAFDTQTIQRSGRFVTVWQRTRYVEPKRSPSGERFIEDLTRSTFYCGSRQHSFDEFIWRDVSGDAIYSRQLKNWEIERQSVTPETLGEVAYGAACDD